MWRLLKCQVTPDNFFTTHISKTIVKIIRNLMKMKKLTCFIICCDYFLYTLAGFFFHQLIINCPFLSSSHVLPVSSPGDHRRGAPAVGPQVIQGPGSATLFVGAHERCCISGWSIWILILRVFFFHQFISVFKKTWIFPLNSF